MLINGKINWSNLLDYNVQPSDMELSQTYLKQNLIQYLQNSRSAGVIAGAKLSVVAGMQIKVSAGIVLMPDGQLVAFPDLTASVSAADPTNPRLDRVEIAYTPTNNTAVLDVNSTSKVLDILYAASIHLVQGTPASSPSLPLASSANISVGQVQVLAAVSSITSANLSQVDDVSFYSSAIMLGNNNAFIRMNQSAGQLQFSSDGVRYSAFGSGGGGGAGANWQGIDAAAPTEAFEYGEKSFLFAQSANQACGLWVRVPSGYLSGSPISMKLAHYSPSTSGAWKFKAITTLIKKNVDAISSTTNQHNSTNVEVTQSVANQYKEVVYDLSSSLGLINGLSVSPGDMIYVEVLRIAPTATEDSSDVRMIPSSTEILFS
jgi:hypothetical protein